MKSSLFSLRWSGLALTAVALGLTGSAGAENSGIPFSEIGAKVTADYQGDALGVTVTAESVWLRCGFQKLEGRATAEGLWLESTAPRGGRLRLMASTLDRDGDIPWNFDLSSLSRLDTATVLPTICSPLATRSAQETMP
jgi:hypothetical protein